MAISKHTDLWNSIVPKAIHLLQAENAVRQSAPLEKILGAMGEKALPLLEAALPPENENRLEDLASGNFVRRYVIRGAMEDIAKGRK